MADQLQTVPLWFLTLAVVVFSGFSVWSLRNIFSGLKESIDNLSKLISNLFAKTDHIETRLSHLEGEHKSLTCQIGNSYGRRVTDYNRDGFVGSPD